ncbi:MAG: hypothetical protein ACLT9V_05900 [Anaerococcus obesiensis]
MFQIQHKLDANPCQGGNWINVKGRTSKFTNYDNRWTGWAGSNQTRYLGTRIIAINEEKITLFKDL